jgi:GDPmannose 4,6-dehydratase
VLVAKTVDQTYMAKRALITGVTGQDGAYLCKLLLEKGYKVFGAYRRSASADFGRLAELGVAKDVERVAFDLLESTNIERIIEKVRPDEIYNLAAQSFVTLSFEQPVYTGEADALGVTRMLEAIRMVDLGSRFYQASTSEMFGKVKAIPQNEETPFHPRSPYGVAKLYAHWITVNYRESYGLHCSSGILFNHESPLRGLEFVTRKITTSLARVKHGHQECVILGNIDAKRDWGFAGDYVEGMWRMVQQPEGDEYVLATGETHSVGEFVELAAKHAGFDLEWQGKDDGLTGIDRKTGKVIMRTDPELYRPAEVDFLLGDSTKARTKLGWVQTVGFEQLVQMMVEADLDKVVRGVLSV